MGYFTATGSITVPQSFITKGKQRLKQNIDTVYLKNGDEFEIELFNPTQNKVLAKIEVNGNSIGNGIILRPGERIYLERYLSEAKKFLFETYNVEATTNDVEAAIAINGNVNVKFYKETFNGVLTLNPSITSNWVSNWGGNATYTTLSSPSTGTYVNYPMTTLNGTSNISYTSGVSLDFNSSQTSNTISGVNTFAGPNKRSLKKEKSIETGRVEKGSSSKQTFDYDNSSSWESFPSTTNWWKIKPVSEKLFVKSDLVTYCTECGSKRKKDTHKFCPHCGTKF